MLLLSEAPLQTIFWHLFFSPNEGRLFLVRGMSFSLHIIIILLLMFLSFPQDKWQAQTLFSLLIYLVLLSLTFCVWDMALWAREFVPTPHPIIKLSYRQLLSWIPCVSFRKACDLLLVLPLSICQHRNRPLWDASLKMRMLISILEAVRKNKWCPFCVRTL